MTEVPQFRVFLDEIKVKDIDLSTFPEGIPCLDLYALDEAEPIPQNFVFSVDKERLNLTENYQLYQRYGVTKIATMEYGESQACLIPLEDVLSVVDQHNQTLPLNLLVQSWIVNNHVFKIKEASFKLSGPSLHILIMGLQQALFIQSTEDPTLNNFFLEQACALIKVLTHDNPTLKEFFVSGFPCEYLKTARDQLHLE